MCQRRQLGRKCCCIRRGGTHRVILEGYIHRLSSIYDEYHSGKCRFCENPIRPEKAAGQMPMQAYCCWVGFVVIWSPIAL
jgi:hypothetical protein